MSIHRETSDDEILQVHELLEDICNVSLKIQEELSMINSLVKDNGEFSVAVEQTNETLLKIIRNKCIDLSFIEENASESSNGGKDMEKEKPSISKNK